MTFRENMDLPLSDTDNTTVAQDICRFLNRGYHERWNKNIVLGYDFIFFFRVPDHEIEEDEIFSHINWEYTQLGSYGVFKEIITHQDLIHVWGKAQP